jgi:hypothetical protein
MKYFENFKHNETPQPRSDLSFPFSVCPSFRKRTNQFLYSSKHIREENTGFLAMGMCLGPAKYVSFSLHTGPDNILRKLVLANE